MNQVALSKPVTFILGGLLPNDTEESEHVIIAPELVEGILSYVVGQPSLAACRDYANVSLTCKRWKEIISNPRITHPLTKFVSTIRPFLGHQLYSQEIQQNFELYLDTRLCFVGISINAKILWIEESHAEKDDPTDFKIIKVIAQWAERVSHWYVRANAPKIFISTKGDDDKITGKLQIEFNTLITNAVSTAQEDWLAVFNDPSVPLNKKLEETTTPLLPEKQLC